MEIQIHVKSDDAMEIKGDVLILKYAQQLLNIDAQAFDRLSKFHADLSAKLPKPGDCLLLQSYGSLGVDSVLFVGVEQLFKFSYQSIREFSRRSLNYLAGTKPDVQRICITLHGANYGLDEVEAFESEIAGLVDAIAENRFPESLKQIMIVEYREERAQLLGRVLKHLLPDGVIRFENEKSYKTETVTDMLRTVGYKSEDKPLIFIAMPFDKKMYDIFHYGIRGAVNTAGFLCERVDESFFTGDIMERVRKRIKDAALIIADLTTANPNVYLEVGLAWGYGKPTVLLVQDTAELKFDVKGQRCITYGGITELEEKLQNELEKLKPLLLGG